MKKHSLVAAFLLSVLILTLPITAFAYAGESEATIMPRWTYIASVDGSLTENGTEATVDCWVKGYYGSATKTKIIAELQVQSSATNWIPVAIWTDTQNAFKASVHETKTINPDNTYRVKITATVWEGSQSETATLFVD